MKTGTYYILCVELTSCVHCNKHKFTFSADTQDKRRMHEFRLNGII